MQGQPRPAATVVQLVVNKELLRAFDALGSPQKRSQRIEAHMLREVLHRKFGAQIAPEHLAEMLALID